MFLHVGLAVEALRSHSAMCGFLWSGNPGAGKVEAVLEPQLELHTVISTVAYPFYKSTWLHASRDITEGPC